MINIPKRISLAQLPSPIQKMSRLSSELNGPQIYMKRDDLTGSGLSGNKVRKLEYIFAHALQTGCDSVITTGGRGSNHARATSIAARQLGLEPYLVLRGVDSSQANGNLLLNHLLGASITWITKQQYSNRNQIMEQIAESLRTKGKTPLIIPEGASNALGAWGYIQAAQEIIDSMQQWNHPQWDAIVVPLGSGGTYAGLLIGMGLHQLSIPVYGINVCDDAEYFKKRILSLFIQFEDQFQIKLPTLDETIRIIDGYVGEGYALNRPEEIEVIRLLAKTEGIFLDPVYTSKAMYGLIDQIKKGVFTKDMNILFIHTGGIFGIFSKNNLLMGGDDEDEFYAG